MNKVCINTKIIQILTLGDKMKTTGMVRRVDSLGRIVIPKEIRKVLKIKENEQVEINISGKEIILNRYSELDEKNLFLQKLIDVIKEVYGVDILLTNLNNFTLTTKDYLYLEQKEISPYLSNILEERKEVLENSVVNLSLNSNEKDINTSFYIKTLIVNGDSVGLIIFLRQEIQGIDPMLFDLLERYLEKYLE